jgi:hypothetical protein
MDFKVNNDQNSNRIVPAASSGSSGSQDLSIHTVLSILSDASKNLTETNGGKAPSGNQMEQAMLLLLQICQQMQISKANLQVMLSNFSTEEARSALTATINTNQAVLDKVNEAQKKAEEAEEAQKWFSIFSWIVTVVVAAVAALTGNVGLALLTLGLQIASTVKVDGEGNTALSALENKLKEVMPDWAAKMVIFGIILVLSIAAANPTEAVNSETNAAEGAVKQILKQVAEKIKQYTPELLNAAIFSGAMPTTMLVDLIPGDSDKTKEIKQILKAVITAITMIVAIIAGAKTAKAFKPVEQEGSMLKNIRSFVSSCGMETKLTDEELKNALFQIKRMIEGGGAIGETGASAGRGVLKVQQSNFISESAVLKGLQTFLDGLSEFISNQAKNEQNEYKDGMENLNSLIKRTLDSFRLFTAQAQAVKNSR